jgi:uncharacterized tellurite resistance protein B-like protein
MFRRRPASVSQRLGAERLSDVVAQHMSGADSDTVQIVAAIAGLLAGMAYADRNVSDEEHGQLRTELGRVEGLSASGVDAICNLLHENIVEVSTAQAPRYTRVLRELADRELRLHILELLVELSAADGKITLEEVTVLRNTATALGLTQADYNVIQARHRDKLSFL